MLLGSLAGTLLGWLMGFLSLFLILLVLIQRGRGGGLTGALGGPGGQSAFGSKAGDTFTVITIVVAAVWAFSCAFTMWLLGTHTPTTTFDNTRVTAGPGDEAEGSDQMILPNLNNESPTGTPPAPSGGLVPADLNESPSELNAPAPTTPANNADATTETDAAGAAPTETAPTESEPAADPADEAAETTESTP